MRCADNQPRSVGNMWTAKKPQNELPLALARRSLRRVEMLLPLETGTIRGQPRDAGTAGKPVVLAGTWHWRGGGGGRGGARPGGGGGGGRAAPGKPGNWRIRSGEADKAPSISYMEGALLHSARQRRSRRADTPARNASTEQARPDDIHRTQMSELGP